LDPLLSDHLLSNFAKDIFQGSIIHIKGDSLLVPVSDSGVMDILDKIGNSENVQEWDKLWMTHNSINKKSNYNKFSEKPPKHLELNHNSKWLKKINKE
jgi:hypothetical protein